MNRSIPTILLCILPCVAMAQQPDPKYWAELEAKVRTNKFVRMESSIITNLPAHAQGWTEVTLHNSSLHLPLGMIDSVTNRGSLHIQFSGQHGFMIFLAQVDHPPLVPFSQAKSAETVTLQELDKAPPEKRNEILTLLECKATKPTGTYERCIVETPRLRAFVTKCWKENDGKRVHITSCDVYSPDDKIGFLMLIRNEPDRQFPFKILNGISFSGKTMERDRIVADVETIRNKLRTKKPNQAIHRTK